MTLALPAAFPKWLVEAVAGYWPDCDEDALRREGDHWKAAADSCRQLGNRHDVAATAEKAALHGYSADTKATRNVQIGDDMCNQAEYFDSMAEQCYQKANDCEFTKLQVIGTGIALLAQLAVDVWLAAPGVVKAAEDRAAAEASWTASARRYHGNIKKVGLECATKRKGLPLAKATAIGFVLGAGTAAAVNTGAQFYQKEVFHHRDKMEWDLVRDAAIIGGVGGGIGARFASRFAPGINKFLGKLAAKSESNIVRYSTHITSGLLIGGVGGLAGAISGAGAGIIVTGHIPNTDELRTSVIQGLVGGFVGSATVFARPLPPGMRVTAKTDSSNSSTSTTPPSTPPSGSGTHPGTTPPGGTPPPGGITPPGGSDPGPRIPREPTPPEPGTPRNGQRDDTYRPTDDPDDGPLPDPPPTTDTPDPNRPQPEPTRPKPDKPEQEQPPQIPPEGEPTPPEPGTPRNGQRDDTHRPTDDPDDGPLPDPPPTTDTPDPNRPQPEPTRPKPDKLEQEQPPQIPPEGEPTPPDNQGDGDASKPGKPGTHDGQDTDTPRPDTKPGTTPPHPPGEAAPDTAAPGEGADGEGRSVPKSTPDDSPAHPTEPEGIDSGADNVPPHIQRLNEALEHQRPIDRPLPDELPPPPRSDGTEPDPAISLYQRHSGHDDPANVPDVVDGMHAMTNDWANRNQATAAVHLGRALFEAHVYLGPGGEIQATKTGPIGNRVLRVEVTRPDTPPAPNSQARTEIPPHAQRLIEQKLQAFAHRYGIEEGPNGQKTYWFEIDEAGPAFNPRTLEERHGTRPEETTSKEPPRSQPSTEETTPPAHEEVTSAERAEEEARAKREQEEARARREEESPPEPELAPPMNTLDPGKGESIGAPAATDTGAKGGPEPRPSEWPYTNPPNMCTVPPGTPLDLKSLSPIEKYLWVVDAEGNFKFAPELQNSSDFMKPLPPDLYFYMKHGDLQPGEGGTARGPARAGGELYNVRNANGTPSDIWCIDNNSSYTFRRVDESGQPLPWLPAESLEAVRQHLIAGGTPGEKLTTNDVLAADRRKRGVP
ncbi:hypothetical protein AB0L63_25560 [Nocardia sp. NPDC051990]|uniref:WXG100-like domain-containing protein n=1 Tax=Nocardia sp. NPDC051990 TaxID=3155285 RepID=UPI00341A77A9